MPDPYPLINLLAFVVAFVAGWFSAWAFELFGSGMDK